MNFVLHCEHDTSVSHVGYHVANTRSHLSSRSPLSSWTCGMLVFHHGSCRLYRGRSLCDFSALFDMQRRRQQAGCRLISEVVAPYAKIACLHAGSTVRVSLDELTSSADGQYANIPSYHSNCCLFNSSFLTCDFDDTCFCVSVCVWKGRRGFQGMWFLCHCSVLPVRPVARWCHCCCGLCEEAQKRPR